MKFLDISDSASSGTRNISCTGDDPGVRHFKLIALTSNYLDHFLILQIEAGLSMLTLEKKVLITSCFRIRFSGYHIHVV